MSDGESLLWKRLRSLRCDEEQPSDGVRIFESNLRRMKFNKSTYSIVPISEVTQGAVEVWATLPDEIRDDPSLASFRQEHERIHGPQLDEQDPLPNEDISVTDENESHHSQAITASPHHENITISVTDEHGQKIESHEPNGDATTVSQLHLAIETEDSESKKTNSIFNHIKVGLLVIVWIFFTGLLMSRSEKVLSHNHLSIPVDQVKSYPLSEPPLDARIGVILHGAFGDWSVNNSHNYLYMYIEEVLSGNGSGSEEIKNVSLIHKIRLLDDISAIDSALEVRKSHVFDIEESIFRQVKNTPSASALRIAFKTNIPVHLPLQVAYDPTPIDKTAGVIYGSIVLLGLYILIIWEIVHRTFAAMIASTMGIGLLALMNERPTMEDVMSWIDTETLLLLFGMMILVAIFSETGIFDYLAVYAYKITNGKVWPLINCLCFFTAIMSSFLDNVTTVLLMTPVSIRLCEVMELNPVPILMSMIIYSNIGGALTPVGDPPNVIIASNSYIIKSGVNFLTFSLHMSIGVILVMGQTYLQLRYKFRNMNDLRFIEAQDVQELRHEIAVWQRAAASLSSYSKDEDLVRETLNKKVNRLARQLKKRVDSGSVPAESYKQTLEDLQKKYPIRNWPLLIKSGVVLVFVISFFFLHSIPDIQRLSLGWTALLGAILLLILADRHDMEAVLARVEWSTLLFFAALFVLMESLAELGLIDWIGTQTENVIMSVDKENRLAVAILIILWVSAIASAFVDNIPLTTMMVKIAISLAEKKHLDLPLQPLVWSLALGACLGGNGTLIGASANVVCAGVAEQHGYRFTFVEYFKVGFPIMIGHIIFATFYLMMAHVVFQWH